MTVTGSTSGLPPELLSLSWLIGTWVGVGVGGYPTVGDFHFAQEVTFASDGRPFLSYSSRAWLLDADGNRVKPLAVESGYWRPRPDNHVEVLLAHPTGFAEVWIGEVTVSEIADATVTGARVELRTDVIARTSSAKEYTAGHRLFGLVDGELMWVYDMAAVGQPLTSHLSARLKKA
ncbi:unannotated protein [freshwater metagenome]|uniref:Unannotated protein n=1 Tax=freshwater metagenome TaxID=449393 RepID=A0A6J7INA7_9ZZZZ|nr:DUF1794 domain-containing protein [Actinomycetota bacterium]MSW36118.1 DUF1794 domain-containing protein [Actinomycetota bacterium]MSX37862.1 DUF1794 domain-containing protein [Actinomycetota bacterium]